MTFTKRQYRELLDALASGELSVQYNNRRVQYRSLAEMLKAKALMEAELFGNGSMARRRHRAIFDKGI